MGGGGKLNLFDTMMDAKACHKCIDSFFSIVESPITCFSFFFFNLVCSGIEYNYIVLNIPPSPMQSVTYTFITP